MSDRINIVENVFTKDQREKLIEDSHPFFRDGNEYASILTSKYNSGYGVGYQEGFNWFKITNSELQCHPGFSWAHKIILSKIKKVTGIDYQVIRSWMNMSNGDREVHVWHNHEEYDYSCVYYMKMFPFFSNGTLFKDYGLVKAKENSLLCFPSHLDHSTPSSPLRFKRYSWAMDLNIKKDLVDGSL